MLIFLSPANHYKPYAVKGHNEKQQMDLLAPMLKEELEKYEGVEVVITKVYADTRQYDGRPEEARDLGADIYLALHTNASGLKPTGGRATGACGFYHPNYQVSKDIATEIVKELNAICPIRSNRANQPAIYPWSWAFCNLGELRVPARYGISPILIEHEFHDRVDGATWIVKNLRAIAEADAKGLAKALKLVKKSERPAGDINDDGKVDNLDASLALQYDAGLLELTDEQIESGDLNNDGKVDNIDASMILQLDAGLDIEIQEGECEPADTRTTHVVGEIVRYLGGYHYLSSNSSEPAGGMQSPGLVKIYAVAPWAADHKYCVIHVSDDTSVCGWVDESTIQ